jgi:4-diphosphocytidyl-2-C-methyl-D-erythritol kinase
LKKKADGTLHLAAPAKINLNLLVGPRREDGYHPIDSFVARVTFYDEVMLVPRRDGRIVLRCTGADCGPDEENLAFRAAELLAEGRGTGGAAIELTKRIPPGRGLGGGSSDAAAVLAGLNELWNLGLAVSHLAELARRLGSDVPFFLGKPAARMTGRGEILQPLAVHPFWAVLYLPLFPCPTAEVFRAYDRLPDQPREQLDPSVLTDPPSRWRGRMANQLLPAARQVSGELAIAYDRLSRALPVPVCMTGSGSGLFALCDDLAEAQAFLAAAPQDLRDACRIVASNDW